MTIIKGTTPTIGYTFSTVDTADIAEAILSIKQYNKTVIERDISTATVDTGVMSWKLTQRESLRLKEKVPATIYLSYVLSDGTRAEGATVEAEIDPTGKEAVIGDE